MSNVRISKNLQGLNHGMNTVKRKYNSKKEVKLKTQWTDIKADSRVQE